MMRPAIILLWAAIVLSRVLPGMTVPATVPQPPQGHAQPSAANPIRAVRAARRPVLDGTLNDPIWRTGALVSDFHQREPFETEPATERTEVRVLYDRRNLYFGVHCFDSHPERIVATELRRDTNYQVDDYFTILISPTNDGRNGYTFTVNPLGTQFDASISNEQQVNEQGPVGDVNWDGVWSSNAQIVSDGWTATIAIPFSTLNFKTSENVTMGLNFARFIRRKNEEDLWHSYLRIYGITRVSQSGELTNLTDIGSGRLFIVKPYVLGGVYSNALVGTEMLHTGGLDFKYGIRSNIVANVTLNTDFAEADVDPQQFNITPFRQFIPEKRQFFLENSGIFQFAPGAQTFELPNTLFFSRQIGIDPVSGEQVPLDAGAKLTGRLRGLDFGVLDAQTGERGFNPSANYFVTRVDRKFLRESYIGAMVVNKEAQNPQDRYNRAGGVDGHLVLFDRLFLDGFFARSSSFAPTLRGHDWSDFAGVRYQSNLIQFGASTSTVQPNYNPEVGFVDRTNIVQSAVDFELSPRPKSGPVREYDLESFLIHTPDTSGVLQTQEWQATFRAIFHNGSYTDDDIMDNFIQRLNAPFNLFGNVYIPPGIYHFARHQTTYGTDESKRLVVRLFNRFGGYYNGSLLENRVRADYHPNPRIALSVAQTEDDFRFTSKRYHVWVGSWGGSYSFNRLLTTNLLLQVNSVQKNPVSANFRVRYNYRPDSDLFVVYNVGSQFNSIAAGNPVLFREQRLSVKLTYSLQR